MNVLDSNYTTVARTISPSAPERVEGTNASKDPVQQAVSTRTNTDTVEISQEGREALARLQAANTATANTASASTASAGEVQSGTPSDGGASAPNKPSGGAAPQAQSGVSGGTENQEMEKLKNLLQEMETKDASLATEMAEETTSATSSSDLTSLSANEIEELVSSGAISRQQADTELARRNGSSAEEGAQEKAVSVMESEV